jgi:cytochrome o ubiquinol oxidase subunit 2
MRKRQKFIVLGLVVIAILVLAGWYLHGQTVALLQPRGPIAEKERNLIIFAALLSLVVVIPVFSMAIFIAWKYRESNTEATYTPEFDHSRVAETIWWIIPTILITILSVVAWNSSHTLDPYRPLSSTVQPLDVQVVALDWKWLFIYPQLNLASVNELEMPVNTPVNFEITSDAPMNSFWIPQLSGQIYAMPGMSTQLHVLASKVGSYDGYSANISGVGFAGMRFQANATKRASFNNWVRSTSSITHPLTLSTYKQLDKPSQDVQPTFYSSVDHNLYTTIIAKYLAPTAHSDGGSVTSNNGNALVHAMPGMSM